MLKTLMVVASSVAMMGVAIAADLPQAQPVPPTPAPVGKMPIGKSPVGKTPIGKAPTMAPAPVITKG